MDEMIERLRRLDPVPIALGPPAIQLLHGRLEPGEPDPDTAQTNRAVAGNDTTPARRSRARSGLAHLPIFVAAAVSIAVAGFALLALQHTGAGSPTPPSGGSPPTASGPPSFPRLSGRQRKQINYVFKAEGTAARRDPTCAPTSRGLGDPGQRPSLSPGPPNASLMALIGTLRRAQAPHDQLPPRKLYHGPHSQARVYPYGTYPPVVGIYARYIRYARHRDGANYYLVPGSNVNWRVPEPERCYREQVTALHQALPQIPRLLTHGIVALQATYLAYERRSSDPYPGVCLSALNATGNGDGASCYAANQIQSGHTLTSGAPGGVPVVYGLAPDDVRSVTFYYPGRNRLHPLTAIVINNVFILHNSRQRLPNYGFPTKLVWRAANGHVIKTIR